MDYDEWIGEVEDKLKEECGIGTNDCADDERLMAAYTAGNTPEVFVDWTIEKYGLDRRSALML